MSKTNKRGRPVVAEEDKAKPNDRLECKVCGGSYTRAHKSSHEKTKQHQIYAKLDDDIRKVVLNKPKQLRGTVTAKEIDYHGAYERVREKINGEKMKRRLGQMRFHREDNSSSKNENKTKNKILDMPKKFHDYIIQHYGTIFFKPEDEKYFNNPTIRDEEKIQTINEIAEMQGKKYHDIYNVPHNYRNQSILYELRDPEKLKKFTQI